MKRNPDGQGRRGSFLQPQRRRSKAQPGHEQVVSCDARRSAARPRGAQFW